MTSLSNLLNNLKGRHMEFRGAIRDEDGVINGFEFVGDHYEMHIYTDGFLAIKQQAESEI